MESCKLRWLYHPMDMARNSPANARVQKQDDDKSRTYHPPIVPGTHRLEKVGSRVPARCEITIVEKEELENP
jgi:hypothetical protein